MLQYSDTSSEKAGLLQECERLVFNGEYGSITNDTNLTATFTNYLNRAQDELATEIMQVDNSWQWDDVNHGDRPWASTDLLQDQSNYTLAVTHLKILQVTILDSDANEYIITPVDQDRTTTTPLSELFDTSSRPIMYDKVGDEIILYPAPDYNETNGLKIKFQRTFDHFTTADTTQNPGVASTFHWLLVKIACYEYMIANNMDNADRVKLEIAEGTQKLKDFYNKRNRDKKPRIIPRSRNSK